MQDAMVMNFIIIMMITRSMASPFHWLLSCLCISNILLIVSNMLESLGALEVIEKMFFDLTYQQGEDMFIPDVGRIVISRKSD